MSANAAGLMLPEEPGGTDECSSNEFSFMYDDETIEQAAIFMEDALKYRSIQHKVGGVSSRIYKAYYSTFVQWSFHIVIFILHMLAFVEKPSSITNNWTSDIRHITYRWQAPCFALTSLEMLCLLLLLADGTVKTYLMGYSKVRTSYWHILYLMLVLISIADCFSSMLLSCTIYFRVRRLCRPFFIIQRSSLMKKVWNCLRRTMPEIASVLMLLFIHLYFFTLLGMLLFPSPKLHNGNEDKYFRTFNKSMVDLLVLLTTANNPDVMMPAYQKNRFYAIYFIIFLVIGLYCLINMLTAIIFNQFRGYFKASIKSSLLRLRIGVRAVYTTLQHRHIRLHNITVSVPVHCDEGIPRLAVLRTVGKLRVNRERKAHLLDIVNRCEDYITAAQLQTVIDAYNVKKSLQRYTPVTWCSIETRAYQLQRILLHKYFDYFSCLIILTNIVSISILFSTNYDLSLELPNSSLDIMNVCFNVYYAIEKTLLIWANGWHRFRSNILELFDGVVILVILILEGTFLGLYGNAVFRFNTHIPNTQDITLWQLTKTINILIILRLIRVIPRIKAISLVLRSILDITRNLAPFGGLLLVLYYIFAILGMELFAGAIKYEAPINGTEQVYVCGSYQQLNYWANNFDDFAASLVLLWNIMVVNNWHVFLKVYSETSGVWSQLYFIIFWLLSVIISVNLFTAFILENFIMRWDSSHNHSVDSFRSLSMHDLFRDDIEEPSEDELLAGLRGHPHFREFNLQASHE